MIYLYVGNDVVNNYWMEALKGLKVHKLLKSNELFDNSLKLNDIIVINLDIFSDINDGYQFLNSLPIEVKAIVLRSKANLDEGVYLIKKGVKAYSKLNVNKYTIKQIINTLNYNNVWMYPELTQYVISHISLDKTPNEDILVSLTSKEKTVALLVASGKSNQQIADELGIALVTVKKHIGHLFEKLNVKDRVSLAILVNG